MYDCEYCDTPSPEDRVAWTSLPVIWSDRVFDKQCTYMCQICFIRTCHSNGVLPRREPDDAAVKMLLPQYKWLYQYTVPHSDMYLSLKEKQSLVETYADRAELDDPKKRYFPYTINRTFSRIDRDRLIDKFVRADIEKNSNWTHAFWGEFLEDKEWHFDNWEQQYFIDAKNKCDKLQIDDTPYYTAWLKNYYIHSPIENILHSINREILSSS